MLADNIKKIYFKYAINNNINNSKIHIIIILITNLKFEISSNKDNSISIHCYQVFKINSLNKDNINNINKYTIIL